MTIPVVLLRAYEVDIGSHLFPIRKYRVVRFLFFFFNDTATTEIYTLSLHDALPILAGGGTGAAGPLKPASLPSSVPRSEEHTSELQSRRALVCRLLLEKKKKIP